MNVRVHVFVSGSVQGVFFRVQTRYEALKRNVAGWIRNTSDGKVEAIFEGKNEDVQHLIAFCRSGPPGAQVTKIDVQQHEYSGAFNGFKIRRTAIL